MAPQRFSLPCPPSDFENVHTENNNQMCIKYNANEIIQNESLR